MSKEFALEDVAQATTEVTGLASELLRQDLPEVQEIKSFVRKKLKNRPVPTGPGPTELNAFTTQALQEVLPELLLKDPYRRLVRRAEKLLAGRAKDARLRERPGAATPGGQVSAEAVGAGPAAGAGVITAGGLVVGVALGLLVALVVVEIISPR
jgi:hypothetical protein